MMEFNEFTTTSTTTSSMSTTTMATSTEVISSTVEEELMQTTTTTTMMMMVVELESTTVIHKDDFSSTPTLNSTTRLLNLLSNSSHAISHDNFMQTTTVPEILSTESDLNNSETTGKNMLISSINTQIDLTAFSLQIERKMSIPVHRKIFESVPSITNTQWISTNSFFAIVKEKWTSSLVHQITFGHKMNNRVFHRIKSKSLNRNQLVFCLSFFFVWCVKKCVLSYKLNDEKYYSFSTNAW